MKEAFNMEALSEERKTVAQQTLKDAAALIERDGWCQNRSNVRKRKCLYMAVYKAGKDPNGSYDGMFMMRDYIDGSPIGWNDEPGRTKQEVIFALRNCADGGKHVS
jgi:hypothetical protein